jgi:hypothetical protein
MNPVEQGVRSVDCWQQLDIAYEEKQPADGY